MQISEIHGHLLQASNGSGSKICTQNEPLDTWIKPVVPWWFNFDPQPNIRVLLSLIPFHCCQVLSPWHRAASQLPAPLCACTRFPVHGGSSPKRPWAGESSPKSKTEVQNGQRLCRGRRTASASQPPPLPALPSSSRRGGSQRAPGLPGTVAFPWTRATVRSAGFRTKAAASPCG